MKTGVSVLLLLFLWVSMSAQTFYDHYQKGQKNQKKENWVEAIQNYKEAIRLKQDDEERVRTYGVNFIGYYPNRELGIVYFHLKDLDNARHFLERSKQSQPSSRAEDYLSRMGPVSSDKKEELAEAIEVLEVALVDDTKPPAIKLLSPSQLAFNVLSPVSNETKQITISGKVEDQSGIYEVLINGLDASISSSGEFSANVFLSVGSNKIRIMATDIHQNSEQRAYTIVREGIDVAKRDLLGEEGKYYALIIGESDYRDSKITDLDGLPLKDANTLSRILIEKYCFEKKYVKLMENPTRTEILRVFDGLSDAITDQDNLLIFYAGHGFYDEKTELGYWLPSDAEAKFTANWIYNDVLVANLKRIQSKHTLLISDACFSGSIFKTRSFMAEAPTAYKKKYELSSRKAITSGVLKTVPNKSVFFKYFADRLESNEDVYMSASQLFQSIEIPVANNSPNTPQYGVIQNVGDEGGDFIFIKR